MSNLWAPKCVFPGCNNNVDYHNRYSKSNNSGYGFKWKQACNYHRGAGKPEFDRWKLESGCANKDAHYGFACTTNITSTSQIDVNHIDGNKLNTDSDNIECLCKVCHARVTVESGHNQNRYTYQVRLNPALWEE